MDYPAQFRDALMDEVKRRLFEEGLPRIRKSMEQLSESEIWYRPNANSNAVGNLVLHLCGNVSQWILNGIGGQPDHRQRQQEFDERGPLPKARLLDELESVMTAVEAVLDRIEPADLLKRGPVQVYEESGLSILVHVVEHFSYHVGQITYIVKAMKDIDLAYYEEDLEGTD